MIWGFGDSFTYGFGCRTGRGYNNTDGLIPEYFTKYKKEGDKIWMDWLGEWFGEEVKNISESGASNDKIFDSILDNFDHINQDDKVVIGISSWARMDIPIDKQWKSIISVSEDGGEKNLKNFLSKYIEQEKFWETIINYQYFFSDSPLWRDRWETRFDFIIKELNKKKCKTISFQIQDPLVSSIQTIYQDCGIYDYHFSFKGHKKFAEILCTKFIQTNISLI